MKQTVTRHTPATGIVIGPHPNGWQHYDTGGGSARAGGRAQYINPHPWGSRLHRMFEFGYYVQERGLTLGAQDYWQTGRGGTFTSPAGVTYRLWCHKHGLGIQRAA